MKRETSEEAWNSFEEIRIRRYNLFVSRGNEVSYVSYRAAGVVSRVRFIKERGNIIEFVAQLECLFDDEWHIVIRYDTAHHFAHRDVLFPDGTVEKTELPFSDYNEAFTFALADLKTNWQVYRGRYERWLKQ